jgi:ATP-binding cassette subfamily B multidrug efflux pump
MKHLFHLNFYFWRYKWHLLLGMLFVLLSNWFRVLQPQMIRHAMDLVIDNIRYYDLFKGTGLQALFFAQLGKVLVMFGIAVLVLALLMGVFMYWMRQTLIVMSRLIERDLRSDIYAQYQRLDMAFYKKSNTGDLMARITEDVSKVRMYLGPAIMYGVNLLGLMSLTLYAMFSVSIQLTLWAILPLPILSVSIYYVSMLIASKSERIQAQLSVLNSVAQESYSGIRVIKSYVQELPIIKHFANTSDTFKERSMELTRVEAMWQPLMTLLIGASTILTILVGGMLVIKGRITPGNIAEFVIYVNMLTWPVTSIGWVASIVQRASASQKRINEFLLLQPAITTPPNALQHTLQGHIEFHKVSFTYPDTGIQALQNISFRLAKGQKLAIIGRIGSGKSTIADLLVRMYDPSQGHILLDGTDIRKHEVHHLRQQIGYVPQDVFLFSDTVANNIAFGVPNATPADIERYAQYASIHSEILSLPQGYQTLVGERGVTLSGGQKQRVSIARALIKKPNLLLLDDCLSAVDTHTEKTILGYLQQELADKTVIVITHRIYALLQFDQIIVLDDGKIVEMGTHQQLIQQKGYYNDLFERQKSEEKELNV